MSVELMCELSEKRSLIEVSQKIDVRQDDVTTNLSWYSAFFYETIVYYQWYFKTYTKAENCSVFKLEIKSQICDQSDIHV